MTGADVFPAIMATWPPVGVQTIGPFLIPTPDEGGNRVRAARLADPHVNSALEPEITAAEQVMADQGRAPLFQVLDTQSGLKSAFDQRGYIARDHTDMLLILAEEIAAPPPPVTAFDIWPPLAVQAEIWDAGGIDQARRNVMNRVSVPKTSLFGRIADQPAGSAFIALHNDMAMLHALEVAPTVRRKGLAVHMMRAAAQWAVENGATWLCVLVTQQNEGAQRLYASLGMKPVGSYVYREKEGGMAQ